MKRFDMVLGVWVLVGVVALIVAFAFPTAPEWFRTFLASCGAAIIVSTVTSIGYTDLRV
jgi:uncharacterized membrane protein